MEPKKPTLLEQLEDLRAKLISIGEGTPMLADEAREALVTAKAICAITGERFASNNGVPTLQSALWIAEKTFIYGTPKAAE